MVSKHADIQDHKQDFEQISPNDFRHVIVVGVMDTLETKTARLVPNVVVNVIKLGIHNLLVGNGTFNVIVVVISYT